MSVADVDRRSAGRLMASAALFKKNCNSKAKSREADMAVSMVKRQTAKEVQVKCIVMDNDVTTISKLKDEIKGETSEMKDLNHCNKN